MSYSVSFNEDAYKEMKKLDKDTSRYIRSWLRKNLEGCSDPFVHGKLLTGKYKHIWRYRIGDYRICALITIEKFEILIVGVRHRHNAYS